MLRVYPLILICLFLFPGFPALAADAHTAPQTRTAPSASQQDLEAIITMAGQGDAGSQNYLGFLYATGQNVPKDEKVAFTWFQKAADQGHPEALGNLAMMYEKGLGVAKNQLTALSLHRQAATAGYPISMKRLASLYETGFEGEERDPVKAEMWKTRYKETLKGGTPAILDADTRQATEKTSVTPVEKPAAPKLAAPVVEKPAAPKLAAPAVEKPAAPKLAAPPVEKPAAPKLAAPAVEKPAAPKLAAPALEKPAAPKLAAPPVEKPATPKLAAPPVEKPASPKLAAPPVDTQPQATAPLLGDAQSKPASTSANRTGAVATPYFIQVGAKATARETMEIIQKIVDRRLLPPNKNIELINPDGKNYRINIGPFADANQAAPYQSQIMALLENAPPAAPVKPEPAAAGVPLSPATPPKAPATPAAPAAPAAAKHDEKPVAPPPIAALPPPAKPAAPSAESHDKEKLHYVEISGKATAQEATELIQKIVETGILPKNMRVEFVSPDTDNYRIRIGPFYDAKDATPQIAKNHTPVKSSVPPTVAQKQASQELIPVAPSPKPAAPVAPAAQEIAPSKTALAAPPKVAAAPAAVDTSAALAETKHSTGKIARGRYYFILLNAKSSFEDSVFLAQTLLKKELVDITHRVKIENLDGQNFRVSIGPFGDANEANRQAKIINQQAFLKSSIMVFEKFATASGATEHQPILQLNAKGDMEHAVTLTQALMEKGLLQQQMFVEIVNFGTGNYRVRYGPFKGIKDVGQDTLNLKKHLKVSPILVNLERLAPLD